MVQLQYAPGPWKDRDGIIYSEDVDQPVAEVYKGKEVDATTRRYNQRVIETAPEMIDELKNSYDLLMDILRHSAIELNDTLADKIQDMAASHVSLLRAVGRYQVSWLTMFEQPHIMACVINHVHVTMNKHETLCRKVNWWQEQTSVEFIPLSELEERITCKGCKVFLPFIEL
jgi:hypothetical protein